jgi:hypothetical protein
LQDEVEENKPSSTMSVEQHGRLEGAMVQTLLESKQKQDTKSVFEMENPYEPHLHLPKVDRTGTEKHPAMDTWRRCVFLND